MPRGQRKPTPLPTAAQIYLGALEVALDTTASPDGRAHAGRFMRDVADGMRHERLPGDDARKGKTHPGAELHPELRAAIEIALDHRICGES